MDERDHRYDDLSMMVIEKIYPIIEDIEVEHGSVIWLIAYINLARRMASMGITADELIEHTKQHHASQLAWNRENIFIN